MKSNTTHSRPTLLMTDTLVGSLSRLAFARLEPEHGQLSQWGRGGGDMTSLPAPLIITPVSTPPNSQCRFKVRSGRDFTRSRAGIYARYVTTGFSLYRRQYCFCLARLLRSHTHIDVHFPSVRDAVLSFFSLYCLLSFSSHLSLSTISLSLILFTCVS